METLSQVHLIDPRQREEENREYARTIILKIPTFIPNFIFDDPALNNTELDNAATLLGQARVFRIAVVEGWVSSGC